MIINAREWRNLSEEDFKKRRCRVFADGVEVNQAWYVDTDAMIVKTYDVLGDGKAHSVHEGILVQGEVELLDSNGKADLLAGVLYSRTIHAKVIELRPFEEEAGS